MDICPIVLERTCCETVDAILDFNHTEIVDFYEEYKLIKKKRIKQKGEVVAKLETLIAKHLEEGKLYYDLLDLKRSIFNDKFNKLLKKLSEQLTLCIDETINDYLSMVRTEIIMKDKFSMLIETKEIETREILKKSFRNNKDLYNAVMHISPTIYHQLDSYMASKSGNEKCKDRKVEDALLKLITKASLKPSPLSTFIKSSFTKISDNIDMEGVHEKIVKAYINNVHILRIFDAVCSWDEVLVRSEFQLNELVMTNSKGDYGFVKFEDRPFDKPKVFKTENVFKVIPKSELIDTLLEKMQDRTKPVCFSQICEIFGVSDDKKGIALVKSLLNGGVLYHWDKIGDNSPDILSEFQNKIIEMGLGELERVKQISEIVGNIHCLVDEYSSCEQVKEKVSIMNEIRRIIINAFKYCEIDSRYLGGCALMYEESFETGIKPFPLSVDSDTIEMLTLLNVIFDGNMYIQTFLKDLFIEDYGEDDRVRMKNSKIWTMLVRSNSEFQYLWQNGWMLKESESYSHTIKQLIALKKDFMKYILELGNQDEIMIDKAYLKENIIAKLPKSILNRAKSYTYFLQGDGEKMVVNNQYAGYFTNYGRFIDNIYRDKDLKKYIAKEFDGKVKVAEIYENFGFNANSHEPVSPYKFVTGNSINKNSTGDFKEIASLDESWFVLNKEEERIELFHEKIGRYRPIILSSMAVFYLPGVLPALHNNSVNIMKIPSFHDLYSVNSKKEVELLPRVSIDNVVLTRKAWRVHVESIPKKELYKTKAELIEAIITWLSSHSIDKEIFLKADIKENIGSNLMKPQYICFTNSLFLNLFYKLIQGYTYLIFEEVYPKIEKKEENYVKEYIYEVYIE